MREPDFVDVFYADKDLSLLMKLTLVIPTYNRNYYLSRCLWYHAHFPFGEIIVADSSPEEKKVVNRETVQKVREMFGVNIRYLEYEPETEKYGGDIYRKWGDAILHSTEEYIAVCVDKAFSLPLEYIKKIMFLDTHLDYIGGFGQWYWIDYADVGISDLKPFLGRDFVTPISLTAERGHERYLSALLDGDGHFTNQLFSVFQTKTLKLVYESLIKYNISDIRFGEIYLSLTPTIYGKIAYFPDQIDIFRDVTQINRKGAINKFESSSTRYPYLTEYSRLGVLDEYYGNFEIGINQTFKEYDDKLSMQEIEDILYKTRATFRNSQKKKPKSVTDVVYSNIFLRSLWERCPKNIKHPIRILLGYDDSKYYIKNESQEYLMIKKIITDTLLYHKIDKSII